MSLLYRNNSVEPESTPTPTKKFFDVDALELKNYNLYDKWRGHGTVKEDSLRGNQLAREMFLNIGDTYNAERVRGAQVPHWSAATVSNIIMSGLGTTDPKEAKKKGFRPAPRHSTYIYDAFQAKNNPNYQYNLYKAQKLGDSTFEVGEILFKGRASDDGLGTSKWKYEDFEKGGDSYPSHTDAIVQKGKDKNGREWVKVAGGNVGNTYINKKYYTDELKEKGYLGKLSFDEDTRVMHNLGSIPMPTAKLPSLPAEKLPENKLFKHKLLSEKEEIDLANKLIDEQKNKVFRTGGLLIYKKKN